MKTAKKSKNTGRWLTLLQVVVGLAVLAGLLWNRRAPARLRPRPRRLPADRHGLHGRRPAAGTGGSGRPGRGGQPHRGLCRAAGSIPGRRRLACCRWTTCPASATRHARGGQQLLSAPRAGRQPFGVRQPVCDAFNTAVTDPYVLVLWPPHAGRQHVCRSACIPGRRLLPQRQRLLYALHAGRRAALPDLCRAVCGRRQPALLARLCHDEAFGAFLQQVKAGSLYDTGVAVSRRIRC